MLAVFKRELKSYFDTVIGFLFIAANIFIIGMYITAYNMSYGYTTLSYALYSPMIIILIAIAILSMKVLSEERKSKTDQLLLTSPVSVVKIVLGKYLAMAAVYSIVVAFICLIPLFLKKFGDIPMKENYTCILAFALYGYAAIAIGMFISSITQTQVISAVITYVVLFGLYMITDFTSLLPEKLKKLGDIANTLSMRDRYTDMLSGTLDLNASLFFVTVIVVMIFMTVQSIQKRRYSVSVKNISLSSYNVVMTVAFIAIAVIINLAASKLPVKYTEIDVTDNKMYTLSDDTVDFVKNLKDDVKIYIASKEDNADTTVIKTLDKMADLSDKLSYDFVDLTVTPKFYEKYTENSSDIGTGDLVVECGDLSKIISSDDLYESQMDYSTYQQNVTGYDAEGKIVGALDYVTGGKQPKVYYLKGHSEAEIESSFTDMLDKANISYEALTLLNAKSVPKDADAVLVNNPQSDISEDDYNKLKDYIDNGGSLFINCTSSELTNMNKLLALYNVTVTDKYVVEGDASYCSQNALYLVPSVQTTDYTSSMTDKYAFAPVSMYIKAESSDDVDVKPLLTTSDSAYAQSVDNESGQLTGDKEKGPFYVGVAVERKNDDKTSKCVVYACSSMFTDNANAMVSNGNAQLFKDNICNIVPEAENKISIPVKSISGDSLVTTDGDANTFKTIVVILIPLISIISGIAVWVSRRKR